VKAKVKRLCGYTQIPELDLFMSINALLRGWTNYFRYANNATNRFLYLTGVVYWLTAHYLGRKHRCSIKRLMRARYGVDRASGKRALYTTGNAGKRVYLWNKPPPRSSLLRGVVGAKDVQPLPMTSWAKGHSFQRHPSLQEGGRHRMAQEMRIHPLGDFGLIRALFDNLLDAPRRVRRVMDGFKEVAGGAIAEMRSQLLGQLRENRHIAALATLGPGDQHHLLLKEELLHLDVHKLRDPGTSLEEGLDQQPSGALHAVGVGDEPPFFIVGQARHDSLALLRPFKHQRTTHFFGHIPRLVVREVM
jgi:hypothetical protein